MGGRLERSALGFSADDLETECHGDGDLRRLVGEEANRVGESIRGREVERIDHLDRVAPRQFGGSLEASAIDRNTMHAVPSPPDLVFEEPSLVGIETEPIDGDERLGQNEFRGKPDG